MTEVRVRHRDIFRDGIWLQRFEGYYQMPSGRVRYCNHRHATEERARTCATILRNRAWKDSQ